MVNLKQVILFGCLLINSQGIVLWMVKNKSPDKCSENYVPRHVLSKLSTRSRLSCSIICVQRSRCLFYGYWRDLCRMYASNKEHTAHGVKPPTTMQSHFRKYKRRKAAFSGYKKLTSSKVSMCLKPHHYLQSRPMAIQQCKAEGATLVKLDSREKVRLVSRELKRQTRSGTFWIGLSYHNDTWQWTDGTDVSRYSNWAGSNINHGQSQTCAGITLRQFAIGKWLHARCGDKMKFVCEKV